MTLVATLAALLVLSSPQASDAQTFRLAGQDVPLKFVMAGDNQMPADYVNWRGWAFLPQERKGTSAAVLVPGGWERVQEELAKSSDLKPVLWRTKIFILERVDLLDEKSDGTVGQRRSSLEKPQVQEALEAIARFMALVKVQSHGKIAIVPDVEIEEQPINGSTVAGQPPFSGFLEDYVLPRINGGAFEADDKLFRGPYQTVIVVHPGLDRMGHAVVMGTPVYDAPAFIRTGGTVDGQLDLRLYDAWIGSFEELASRRAMEGSADAPHVFDHDFPGLYAPEESWSEVALSSPASAEAFAKRSANSLSSTHHFAFVLSEPSYHSLNVTGALVTDVDRGTVLRYTEKGASRAGSLVSPSGDVALGGSRYLCFWAKSSSHDPLAVEASDRSGDSVDISLGGDGSSSYAGYGKAGEPELIQTGFKADGTWQRIIVDLSKTHLKDLSQLIIGPSPSDRLSERQQAEPIVYDFDDFRLLEALDAGTSETLLSPPKPDFNSKDPAERILALQAYAKNPSQDSKGQALKLLADIDDTVRLNATVMIGRLKEPDAEQALTANAGNLDPRIDEAALNALAALGTEAAWATIRHALLSGPTDLARITSAKLLASKNDPTLAGPISGLLGQPSWEVRKAAAEAIGSLKGREPSIILMAFLQELNPAVRLVATKNADETQEYVCGKLLYSAVNDASDAVRAWSCVKLIMSPIESFRNEGYKGVRDDSRAVRILILQQLAQRPSEMHRGALRIAVADSDPEVRACALRAFATMPGAVSEDEIANTLKDKHPWVQSALVELAIAKKLSLPKQTLLDMEASADPSVVARAKELGG